MRRRSLSLFALVFALGSGLRLIAAGKIDSFARFKAASRIDYFESARTLSEFGVLGGEDEPSAFRGIAYPAFLSAFENYAPGARPRTLLADAFLGSMEIILAGWVGLELHSVWAGLAAAALTAFDPVLRSSAPACHIETFYGLILLLVAAALVSWARRPTPARLTMLGFAIAVSLLCRGVLFIFPPVLIAAFFPRTGLVACRWKNAAILLVMSYIFLLPWIGRNAYQFGRFIPFEDHAAARNFFMATCGIVDGAGSPYRDVQASDIEPGDAQLSWSENLARLWFLGFKNIAAAPGAYALSCWRRLAYFMRLHWLLFALAALGFFLCRGNPGVYALGVLWTHFVLIHIPMAVEARYLEPILPCAAILAGCALVELAGLIFPRSQAWPAAALKASAPERRPSIAVVALILLVPLYLLSVERLAAEVAFSRWPCALPQTGLSSFYCGKRHEADGNLEAAEACWEKGLVWTAGRRDKALRMELLSDLALLDLRSGKQASADKRLAEVFAGDPDRLWRKALDLQDHRMKDALLLFDGLVGRYPDNAEYLVDRAIAYLEVGRPRRAGRDLDHAVAVDPQNARAWLCRGAFRANKGEWEPALRDYNRGLALSSRVSPLRTALLSARETALKELGLQPGSA